MQAVPPHAALRTGTPRSLRAENGDSVRRLPHRGPCHVTCWTLLWTWGVSGQACPCPHACDLTLLVPGRRVLRGLSCPAWALATAKFKRRLLSGANNPCHPALESRAPNSTRCIQHVCLTVCIARLCASKGGVYNRVERSHHTNTRWGHSSPKVDAQLCPGFGKKWNMMGVWPKLRPSFKPHLCSCQAPPVPSTY